jgi:hypothetical protein
MAAARGERAADSDEITAPTRFSFQATDSHIREWLSLSNHALASAPAPRWWLMAVAKTKEI